MPVVLPQAAKKVMILCAGGRENHEFMSVGIGAVFSLRPPNEERFKQTVGILCFDMDMS